MKKQFFWSTEFLIIILVVVFSYGCASQEIKKDAEPVSHPVPYAISTLSHTYCPLCHGLGLIKCSYCDGYGVAGDCFFCKGTGRTADGQRCYFCRGTGNRKCPFCQGMGIVKCPGEVSEAGITKGLSDVLRTTLFKTKTFTILERSKMNEILTEQKFQMTGCTTDECAVEIGRILNVNYMVIGSVVKIGSQYIVNIRFVSIETSEFVDSEIGKCERESNLVDVIEKITNDTVEKMTQIQPNPKARAIAILDLEVK